LEEIGRSPDLHFATAFPYISTVAMKVTKYYMNYKNHIDMAYSCGDSLSFALNSLLNSYFFVATKNSCTNYLQR
jgi:hypothetical protein